MPDSLKQRVGQFGNFKLVISKCFCTRLILKKGRSRDRTKKLTIIGPYKISSNLYSQHMSSVFTAKGQNRAEQGVRQAMTETEKRIM